MHIHTHTHTQETPKSKVTQGILGLRAGLFPVSPLDTNHSACSSCEEGEPDFSPPLLPIVTADIVEYRGGECAKKVVGWTRDSRLASVARAQLRPSKVQCMCTTCVCILHTHTKCETEYMCSGERSSHQHTLTIEYRCALWYRHVLTCQSPYTDSVQGFSILYI